MVSEAQLIGRWRPAQARDLLRRGLKVQARARVLLSGGAGHPKRIDTGDLRSSIQVQLRALAGAPVVRIGSGKKHAAWVHDGTGIFGPRGRPITPKSAKVLVFPAAYGAKAGKNRGKVFTRSVKGMPGNPYLRDALPAARD